MVSDIYIEKEISKEEISKMFKEILKVKGSDILFIDNFSDEIEPKNSYEFVIQVFKRPSDFLTSLGLFTNHFDNIDIFHKYLQKMCNYLGCKVFIDTTENSGLLFMPGEFQRQVAFEIGVKNGEEYILLK